jgi:uncharacterized protein involved in cysteine biosynthesis
MGFLDGLKAFFAATSLIFREPALRRWYRKRLFKAIVLGLIVLFTVLLILGFGIFSVAEWSPTVIPMEWLQQLLVIAIGVMASVVVYFTAGPVALLIVGLYLSQVGDWDELKKAMPSLPPLKERVSLVRDITNTLSLALIVLAVSVISLIPIFSILSLLVAAYALGRDWCWTADSVVDHTQRRPVGAAYVLGLGLIPALVATIPVVGTALLPIVQIASLMRYSSADPHR